MNLTFPLTCSLPCWISNFYLIFWLHYGYRYYISMEYLYFYKETSPNSVSWMYPKVRHCVRRLVVTCLGLPPLLSCWLVGQSRVVGREEELLSRTIVLCIQKTHRWHLSFRIPSEMVLNKPLEVKMQSFSVPLVLNCHTLYVCTWPDEIAFVSFGPIMHIKVANMLTSKKIMYPFRLHSN